mgnify:FL=1
MWDEIGPGSKKTEKIPRKCRNEDGLSVIRVKPPLSSALDQLSKNNPENHTSVMNDAVKRAILRSIHLLFSIPILGYIYSPFEKIPLYAPATRYFFVPVLVLSGLWMWKGHLLRRLISKQQPQRKPQ